MNDLPPPKSKAEFDARIEAVVALFDCSVPSGFRTEKRNTLVGGAKKSQHRISAGGLAADLVPDHWPPDDDLLRALHALGLRFLVEDDHVHVQARKPGA